VRRPAITGAVTAVVPDAGTAARNDAGLFYLRVPGAALELHERGIHVVCAGGPGAADGKIGGRECNVAPAGAGGGQTRPQGPTGRVGAGPVAGSPPR